MILEACCDSLQSCLNAQKGGAWRVELCSALELGGLTPSSATIQLATQYTTMPIMVLIRPRVGDFFYSRYEIQTIRREIDNCKAMGATGVVIGLTEDDGTVPMKSLRDLVQAARPMEVTFHRAFDLTPNPFEATETIIEAGCDRILTSGQQVRAEQGIELIANLQEKYGNDIRFMVGSGVHAGNIPAFAKCGITEFHMSGSRPVETGKSSDLFALNYAETDANAIREARDVIRELRKDRG